MKTKAYMLIDVGTGNTRVGIVTPEGKILALEREDSKYYEDHDFANSIYFKPEEWKETIYRLAHQALEKVGDVEIMAVSSSSQRQGIVLIGKDGGSILGFPNSDMRGDAYIHEMDWERITAITGLDEDAFYSSFKVLGTKKKQPEIAAKVKTYTSISDWIGYLFTGEVVWERAQAAHSMGYDIAKDGWSEELCALTETDYDMLPPIAIAGSILGPVKEELVREFGLAEDAVFVVGTADTQGALYGAQAAGGEVVAVNGTTTPMAMVLDEIKKVPCWLSPYTEPGRYMLEANCGATGINTQRIKDKFLGRYSYRELEEKAAASGEMPKVMAMFAEEFYVPDELCTTVGFLFEEEIPMNLEPYELMQAMMYDVAFSVFENYTYLTTIEPTDKKYIIGCGGGFQSDVMAQAFADISGREVWLPEGFAQSTLYGVIHLCNQAMGCPKIERKMDKVFRPRDNEALIQYYRRWKGYRDKMKAMNELSGL